MKEETKNILKDKFNLLKNILLKPVSTMEEHQEKLSDKKESLIFSGIIAGLMLVVTLIQTLISSCFVESYDFKTFKPVTEFSIEGIKNVKWLSEIFNNALVIILWMGAIALIYYLATIIIKKDGNFFKNLNNTAASFLPIIIGAGIVSPILGLINSYLTIIVVIATGVYSILVLLELMNNQIKFKTKDGKIYFNFITLSLIAGGIYYLLTLTITNAINSNISSFF